MKPGVDFWKILDEVMPTTTPAPESTAPARPTVYPSHWFGSILIPTLDHAASVFANSPHRLLLHRTEWSAVGPVTSLQFWLYDRPDFDRTLGEVRRRTSKYVFIVPDGRLVEVRSGLGHMVRDGEFPNPIELLNAQPAWIGAVVARALRELRDARASS